MLIVLGIALLIFGAAQLPETGRGLVFCALFVVPGLVIPLAVLGLGVAGVHWRGLELVAGVCTILAGLILRYLVLISSIPVRPAPL